MSGTYILGISAFYHDAAAALIKNGKIVAAAQEERFSRKKHDADFPRQAINFCLKHAGITSNDLAYVAFYEKPFIKFERLITTYLAFAPAGIFSFIKAIPVWLKQKLFIKNFIENELKCDGRVLFPEHHFSHGSSAFYPSPFKKAAILTIDGVGEWATASFGIGNGNQIKLSREIKFPHSLGLLYSAFTYYVGFRVNSGEYKLMGLAPYGQPKYAELIKKELVDIKTDGSFKLNLKYFNYCVGLTMTNAKFHKLFGGPPRRPDLDKIEQRHMDIAASIQQVTEEIISQMTEYVYNETKEENLCLAGGVALNCVANGKVLRQGPFKNIWIQPAATDAGGALGAALAVWYTHLKNERITDECNDAMQSALLGPEYSDSQIESYLRGNNLTYKKLDVADTARCCAQILAEEKVLGWFQGKMEYGPRALGARSILGDPRSTEMQSLINLKIKFRESFRPFAPTVLLEKTREYFDLEKESPYMLLTAPVKDDKRLPISAEERQLSGLDKLKIKRSEIPAVTHVDYSSRIQTVKSRDNPKYHDLIKEFDKLTGCPVVINTSFNVRGEPLVCSPDDAYQCFMRTNMDYLIMGSFLLDKQKQPANLLKTGDLRGFQPD